ncbi:hypothetical protein ME3_00389 [Bartonella melophagi K-2C]|uniref:Uncharacterized protein n=1 Tax=Bartonella melophagi K-2C TaxID=1094557 RepID=J0ZRJ6_9HYPH|nr:hypothetical protein ME3_00389 [Bartonella melophagi K-2C]
MLTSQIMLVMLPSQAMLLLKTMPFFSNNKVCLCLPLSLHSLYLSFKKIPHALALLFSSHNASSSLRHNAFSSSVPIHCTSSFLTRMPLQVINSLSQAISLPPFKTRLPHRLKQYLLIPQPQTSPQSNVPLPFKGNTFLLNKTTHQPPQAIKRAIRDNEDTFLTH